MTAKVGQHDAAQIPVLENHRTPPGHRAFGRETIPNGIRIALKILAPKLFERRIGIRQPLRRRGKRKHVLPDSHRRRLLGRDRRSSDEYRSGQEP